MTVLQLYMFNCVYLLVLSVVIILTRARVRRTTGAVAGGAVVGIVILVIIGLGERVGWWHFVMTWKPYFLTLFYLGLLTSVGSLNLIIWRIIRRFGWRGLLGAAAFAGLAGPPRDRWWMARFPEWGSYGPGLAPVVAIGVTYVVIVALGQAIMHLVAGPAKEDQLAPTFGRQ